MPEKILNPVVYSILFLFAVFMAADYSVFTPPPEPISADDPSSRADAPSISMAPAVQSSPDNAMKSSVASSMRKLPMMFEENRGQTDAPAGFISRGQGYMIYLAEGGAATLGLRNGAGEGSTSIVKMTPIGVRVDSQADGIDIQQAKRHYYKGSDPTKWALGVALYGKVAYSDIYDGIDLVYYGNPQNLEYDFVISPGADPSMISLAFDGAQSIMLDESEDLVLSLSGGDMVLKAPIAYQEKYGKRLEVASRYVMEESGRVAFSVGPYDTSLPLVIDPVISYSTLIGGAADEEGQDIALDGSGNIYVTGDTFDAAILDRTINYPDTDSSGHHGAIDMFVTKLSPTGTMLFSALIGGSGTDVGTSIAIDDTIGHIYITGYTADADDDYYVTDGSTHSGLYDVFITELTSDGTLVYSTLVGGSGDDQAYAIAVDDSRNIYVTGKTTDSTTDYPVTDDSKHHGADDVFVTKLSAGRQMVFSTLIGGSFVDIGSDIAVDDTENVYVTGHTFDAWESLTDYPVTDSSTHSGKSDMFVTKLSRSGGIAFSTLIGGSDTDHGTGIALDDTGNIYVTGEVNSPDYPVTNFSSLKGIYDAFITRLSPAGVRTFSTYIGGSGSDHGHDIAVNSAGTMYVTGEAGPSDYPTTDGSHYSGGVSDVFVTKLGADGGLSFSTLIGGSLADSGEAIAVDGSGNIYITGYTPDSATGYPVTDDSTHNGGHDIFITRLSPTPDRASLVAPSGNWTNSPTYTWNAVPNATWYYLWVDDSEKNAVSQWYRASEVGCESGSATCSIDPSTALAMGGAKWWVRTWSTVGYGVWSEGESFNVQ